MGLFVLQCKHREGDSSKPGNLIESPSAFNLIFWQKLDIPVMSSLGHRGSEKSKKFSFGLSGLGKILPPEIQVGQNWPLYGQRWSKLKIYVRDST